MGNIKNLGFLLNVSHIQRNYAFLFFCSILGKIHRELLFLGKKVSISERSTELLRKFVFLTFLKRLNPEENLELFKQLFLIKPVKGTNINKNCFSPQRNQLQINYAFLLF